MFQCLNLAHQRPNTRRTCYQDTFFIKLVMLLQYCCKTHQITVENATHSWRFLWSFIFEDSKSFQLVSVLLKSCSINLGSKSIWQKYLRKFRSFIGNRGFKACNSFRAPIHLMQFLGMFFVSSNFSLILRFQEAQDLKQSKNYKLNLFSFLPWTVHCSQMQKKSYSISVWTSCFDFRSDNNWSLA